MMFRILHIVKGGKYRYAVTDPPHPRRNSRGYYPLHIVRCENKHGRLMAANELVHHRNEDKTDDSSSNLEFKDRALHTRDHVLSRRQCFQKYNGRSDAEVHPASAPTEHL